MNDYHFIGIGGIGMSALASILLDKKVSVTGSDISENYVVKKLSEKGAAITLGQKKENITAAKTIVYSTDIKKENPEIEQALALKCRLLHRSDLLKELMEGYCNIAIAGTHGKTSITALLVSIFKKAELDPSYAIGGMLSGENGKNGKGKYFIAEADESDGTFLKYHPFAAIVSNVEKEHMNYYKDEKTLHDSFKEFMGSVQSSEHLFYCGDDPILPTLCEGRGISYGFNPSCDLKITSFQQKGWRIFMNLSFKGKIYENIEVALVGKMHALNAAAAFGLALSFNIPEDKIREALVSYAGVKRRLEKKGEVNNVLFLDDYGHHPTEIRKTLLGLKEAIGERRLIAFFQPHRYSRTCDLFEDFSTSFESADFLFVTDIYGANEKPIEGITSQALVKNIQRKATVPVQYLSKENYISFFKEFLRPHDVIVTIGAGDITNYSPPLIDVLQKDPPKKYVVGVIFGGRSAEHEISLRSTRFVLESLNPLYYEVKLFGIDKKGMWVKGDEALHCLKEKTEVLAEKKYDLLDGEIAKDLSSCDIYFPVLHGPNGEDGTIQGFFEMLGKPYAGADFRSCAITMDKILTKKLLLQAGVPTSKFFYYSFFQWVKDKEALLKEIATLQFPIYVKPSRLGSSIGITRVECEEELEGAIHLAFSADETILIEEGTVNGRELEFAVIGSYPGKIDVPHPGEKCAGGTYVNYEMKYSSKSVTTDVNPKIDKEILAKGKKLAEMAYTAIGITGISRVDCLLDQKGNFNFFEINAIPGMTKLSLFPKIWAREGVESHALIDRLILLGLLRRRNQNRHEHV